MIQLKHGVQVLLGCTLVYATACGGSTSPGDSGGMGTAGAIGSFAGGIPTAGSSATSAGAFGESGGSLATAGNGESSAGALSVGGGELGGDTSSGGAIGSAGSAPVGMGGASAGGALGSGGQSSCPAAAPADRSVCTSTTPANESCLYVGESCVCRAAIVIGPGPIPGGGAAAGAGGAGSGVGGVGAGGAGAAAAARTWRCTGSGAACPATVPTTGEMCTNPARAGAAALDCPYPDGKTCRCADRRWECTEPPPPACPAKEPTGACTTVQACNYGTAAMRIRCACDGAAWACDMAGGAAPRCMAKPPAALATGDTCTGIGACPVTGAAAATCVCNGKTVTCR